MLDRQREDGFVIEIITRVLSGRTRVEITEVLERWAKP
jgi:hypothetical protein